MSVIPHEPEDDRAMLVAPVTAPCSLLELYPEWIEEYYGGAPTGRVVGIRFLCPCKKCQANGVTLAVRFANPLGGGAPSPRIDDQVGDNEGRRWQRAGESFVSLTLAPSIDASAHGHWHGCIDGGRAR